MSISSAGTRAMVGAPSCDISLAMVGERERVERSRQLSAELLRNADLVITAERSHVRDVLQLAPELRGTCFTARSGARLAQWVVAGGALEVAGRKAAGQHVVEDRQRLASLALPLPASPAARLRWLVAEMDAGRGHAFLEPGASDMPFNTDDIPDAHVVGYNFHRMGAELITASMDAFAAAATAVLSS